MTTVLFILGVALLLVLFIDVHMTVFVPRGGAGIVARMVYARGWKLWHWVGNRMFSGDRRRFWLAQFGPLLVPLTILIWGVLLVTAFTLMYTPWVSGFTVSPTETGPMADWAKLLYYSGYAAVTLGVGDVVPSATAPRVMAFVQAGLGFALFTATVSYMLSVYSARNQSITLAVIVSRLIGRQDGRDPVNLLVETISSNSVVELNDWMEHISLGLATLTDLIGQYPLVHYFHEPTDDRALLLALRHLLELTTLCRAVIDPDEYPSLARGPSVRTAHQLGRHFLEEGSAWSRSAPGTREEARRLRYEEARQRLKEADIALRDDADAWTRFHDLSIAWDLMDDGMRKWLGYRTNDGR